MSSQPTVLVVDYDEGFGAMLKDGLNNTGQFVATWAETGSDALQSVVEENYELVIIDVGLPDMKLHSFPTRRSSDLKSVV